MMKNRKSFIFIFLALFSLVSGGSYSQEKLSTEQIEQYIDTTSLSSAFWGIVIEELSTNERLVEYNSTKSFVPASVTKLFTTTAALQSLGVDYSFRTSVYSTSYVDENGKISGNLILKGRGDPTLKSCDLKMLANQLHSLGIRTIKGSVIADDSHFSGTKLITHSEWEDFTWHYCPEISALTLDDNSVMLKISPNTNIGELAIIELEQNVPYLKISSFVTTASEEYTKSSPLNIQREVFKNELSITGSIPINCQPIEEKIAIHSPAEYARLSFIKELSSAGIIVEGKEINGDIQKLLVETYSPPLKEILTTINKTSYNLGAELVFLEASENSLKLLKKELQIEDGNFAIYSGSGLSRHNYLTPNDVCSLLKYLHRSKYDSVIIETLPIAGIDGTLMDRFIDTFGEGNIEAKTGWFSGSSSLAGFATARSRKKVCFCVFVNNFTQQYLTCCEEVDNFIIRLLDQL